MKQAGTALNARALHGNSTVVTPHRAPPPMGCAMIGRDRERVWVLPVHWDQGPHSPTSQFCESVPTQGSAEDRVACTTPVSTASWAPSLYHAGTEYCMTGPSAAPMSLYPVHPAVPYHWLALTAGSATVPSSVSGAPLPSNENLHAAHQHSVPARQLSNGGCTPCNTAQHRTRDTYTRENESEYTLGAVTTATLPGATCAHWATT